MLYKYIDRHGSYNLLNMSLGNVLIISGIVLIVFGILFSLGNKFGIGRLPGDIVIEKENFKFYFPIITSIILSIFIGLIFILFRVFK